MNNAMIFSKFVIVGLINTVLGYGLFTLFLYLGVFYLAAMSIAHIIATINSYILNRKFTFRSKEKIKGEFFRFIGVYLLMFAVNFALLYIAVDILRIRPQISQLVILVTIVIISFLGQKYFTFRLSKQID